MGRSFPYDASLGAEICERIARGETIRTICALDHMPSAPTLFNWLRESDDFAKRYARAREESADASAERIVDIAEDVITKRIEPDAGRVAIDAHKWAAGKRAPKKYGDRQILSGDDAAPVAVTVSWLQPDKS